MMDGRSVSALNDNNQDKARQFVENYNLVEPLSIGAHSNIWKVQSKLTRQYFVLKIIKKSKFGRHWKKFMPPINKLKTIDHQNQQKFYLLFHDKQNFYLVHELIEGKTLYEEYLLEGGFTELQMCTFAKQII